MGDDITIGVTEIVNNIEVTAQPNDQIVDISVVDNADDITLNITPTVIEINVNKGSSYAKWGDILGTLSDQTDLQDALDLKANLVGGKVPASELPSFVDDVIEVANFAALPIVGEISKIYVTLDNNKIYRWSGSVYIEIAANSAIWGAITGTLSNQTDLQSALNAKQNALNGTGFVKVIGTTVSYDNSTYALDSAVVKLIGNQTITGEKSFNNSSGIGIRSNNSGIGYGFYGDNSGGGIGVYINNTNNSRGFVSQNDIGSDGDLFSGFYGNDRKFFVDYLGNINAISFIKSGGTSSQFLKADGSVDTNSYILSVAANAPLSSTGGTSPVISITQATTSSNGYLSSTDWNTFNNKVPTSRTLTINGTAYDLTADRSWTINALPSMLEYNDTDKTIWNNGKNNIATNTSFGDGALKTNTSGAYNTSFGVSALNLNTTGSANTAVSTYTLSNNTSGYNNTGIGYESLLTNTTGYDNTGVGADALVNNLGGNSNSAVGYGALSSNTSGISNSSVGKYSLGANTTGNYNVGFGYNAGNATLGGGTLNTTSSQSTYIGAFASCSANGVTNEIAIGYASSGNGSNSVTLGNTSITKTILIGNVGIGTTSPGAKLTILGSNSIGSSIPTNWAAISSGRFGMVNGNNSFYFDLNPAPYAEISTYNYSSGATFPLVLQGNGGNVGIGTTSPGAKLDVDANGFSIIANNAAGNRSLYLGTSGGEPTIQATLSNGNARQLSLNPNGGNVGIGTTIPNNTFDVRNTVSTQIRMGTDQGTRPYWNIGRDNVDTGNFVIADQTSIKMSITNGGNVGIGTTSPGQKLTLINGTFQIGGTSTFSDNIEIGRVGGDNNMAFATGGSERMRITSSGNVCIGTTDTGFNARQLIRFEASGASTNGLSIWNGGGSGAVFAAFANSGGGFVGSITQIGTTGVAYNITSDYRLKQDFKQFNGLDLVSKIKVYDYEWKSDKSRMNGVIAHELQEVVPYAVTGEKDAEQMQQVDYSKLVPILIQSIQELKAEIEILKQK